MLHSFWHDGTTVRQNIPVAEWPDIVAGGKGLLWVDMEDPTEDEIDLLSDAFKFHALAVEDCIFPNHRPKVDDYESYLYIIFHAITLKNGHAVAENLDVLELNIFIGANYLVTFHEDVIPQINHLRSKGSMQGSILSKGPGFLLHAVMDQIVDEMTRTLAQLEDRLDGIEDNILSDEEGSLKAIHEFKDIVSKFRKIAGPQLDVVRLLSSNSFAFITAHQAIYFKDIRDHLLTIMETTILFREVIASTMDAYLSMVSKKMNNVMKVLTVVTTIFLPLQLIASIYGMNFKHMPELEWQYGYGFSVMMMIAIAVTMWFWFRKMKWF